MEPIYIFSLITLHQVRGNMPSCQYLRISSKIRVTVAQMPVVGLTPVKRAFDSILGTNVVAKKNTNAQFAGNYFYGKPI